MLQLFQEGSLYSKLYIWKHNITFKRTLFTETYYLAHLFHIEKYVENEGIKQGNKKRKENKKEGKKTTMKILWQHTLLRTLTYKLHMLKLKPVMERILRP